MRSLLIFLITFFTACLGGHLMGVHLRGVLPFWLMLVFAGVWGVLCVSAGRWLDRKTGSP